MQDRIVIDWSNKLNCLVVGIPYMIKDDIDDVFHADINQVEHISKEELIEVWEISRSRYLFMLIFKKYLNQIGNPIILRKELKFPLRTKKVLKPYLRKFLKVFQKEIQKEQFRYYFLEFLNSAFLKDHIQNTVKNSNLQMRLLKLIPAFENCMASNRLLMMLREALSMDSLTFPGWYQFESYGFYFNAIKDQWIHIINKK